MRSKGTLVLIIVVVVLGLAGCAGCSTYNSLVNKDESVEQAWANVETNYQHRADLVPNLVNTVRGSANFERGTLEAVTNARARATSINLSADDIKDPAKLQQFQAAQDELGRSLGRLLVVSENYPQLRATEQFQALQEQLEGIENRINVARRDYNGSVADYNKSVRRFPAALFAGIMGFDRRTPFEAQQGAERAPEVKF